MKRILSISLAAGAALAGLAAPAGAVTIFGLTSANELVAFDSATPGTVINVGVISQPGIVDIDFSAVNGQLYGFTSNASMYKISLSNASATFVQAPVSALSDITDADFNPSADRVRLFGLTDQNYRVTPDVSATNPPTGTPGAVTLDGTFSNTAVDLQSSAYTNNFDGTATTTLYSIDSAGNQLIIHSGAPAFSTVAAVGLLGVDVASAVGFDIGADGVAYLTNGANLYTVNLGSGLATSAGVVGAPTLVSVAVPVPEPGTGALAALGLAWLAAARRRARA